MGSFTAMLSGIAMLVIIISIGFAAEKTGYVTQIADHTSKTIRNITLPLLVISSLTARSLTGGMVHGALIVLLGAVVCLLILGLLGAWIGKRFGFQAEKLRIHICLSAFGNVIFLAFPLIQAVFGADGLFYATVYVIVNDFSVWTLGVYLLTGGTEKGDWKKLVNPNTISFLIGIVLLLCRVPLPAIVSNTLSTVGSATIPLSMLFIGSTLATVKPGGVWKETSIYVLSAIKMVLLPILMMLAIRAWVPASVIAAYRVAFCVLILQAGMPCQSILAILAKEYHLDEVYASGTIFLTILFGALTLPLLFFLQTIWL